MLQRVVDYVNGTEQTFEELEATEYKRRDLLKMSKKFVSAEFFYTIQGTVLGQIFGSVVFWVTLFVYLSIRIAIVDYKHPVLPIQTFPLSVIGGFVSFFLTFFVNQTFSRFSTMYFSSKAVEGRLHNLILV